MMKNFSKKIVDLTADDLEHVACYLDTESCVNLLLSCKTIMHKLNGCGGFWRQLCHQENFHEYTALKADDHDDDDDSERSRLCWSGKVFHDVQVDPNAPVWRRVFVRGMAMRRNICQGKYELWRLFLTDQQSLPVKRMSKDTSFRELRSSHRHSKIARDPRRRVRIHRYWNEDYLVAVQHATGHGWFHDVFVWRWHECQNPKFLYNFDLKPLYPTGLFPTAFFLWKNYLVLMPETGYCREDRLLTSMVRVHDLEDNMKLVGSYDFSDGRKRHVKASISSNNEAAHLHKLCDKAVALCRVPQLFLFVFNLPDCQLLRQVDLHKMLYLERPLDLDDLDQRFLMRDNTMIFMFHDPDFFSHLFLQSDDDVHNGATSERRYGRLLFVDFDAFSAANNDVIKLKVDSRFDANDDYIEKMSVIAKDKMVCVLMSGRIVIRDVVSTGDTTCTYVDTLTIPCPQEGLKEDHEDVETDGPTLCTSRNGTIILVMRHFLSGRKIHTYDTSKGGQVVYTIDLDRPGLGLTKSPGYISVDMDSNFICAADQDKIVVWNSKNGRFIRTIDIPPHYCVREDPNVVHDRYCWKGHTDFAFAEDGIIIVHSERNFPIAADVMLFW